MPNVFEDVPWPVNFLEFTLPLNIVNLDFLSAFVRSSCSLAVPFLDRFVLHMMLPPLLLSSVLAAFFLSKKVCIKSDEKLNRGKELLSQILILGVLFIYPGLATRIFSTWKCKSIQGVNDEVLAADFSVKCFVGKHLIYSGLAFGFLMLYILGLPFGLFMLLWKNRKHLNDTNSDVHESVKESYGGLYEQYEPQYWW